MYDLSRNMKNIKLLPVNFPFLVVKFSIYLNRRVFVMKPIFRFFSLTERKGQLT